MASRYPDLEKAIVSGVERAVAGRRVAVAFSGGLDSGLAACLSERFAESVTLYTCGSDGSFDVLAAEELSETIGLPWVHLRISEDDVEDTIRRLISATGTDDPFTISYELQLFTVCESAEEPVIVSGQGADEYFMGCAKYVECTDGDYDAYVKDGVRRLMEVSVPCELAIAEHFGKTLYYPPQDGRRGPRLPVSGTQDQEVLAVRLRYDGHSPRARQAQGSDVQPLHTVPLRGGLPALRQPVMPLYLHSVLGAAPHPLLCHPP